MVYVCNLKLFWDVNYVMQLLYTVELGYNISAREIKKVRINRSKLYPNKDLSTDCSVKYSIFYDERVNMNTKEDFKTDFTLKYITKKDRLSKKSVVINKYSRIPICATSGTWQVLMNQFMNIART